ncbi:MAG: ATP-binding protein, partial [Gammaproteobacteria bacterium]|nr:ATP-binding protein [Gammaproteobacteria bacterium]
MTRVPPSTRATLLASSTFRLALRYLALFTTSVLVLFAFLYWSTAAHMARQADTTIETEITGLAERYRERGLAGLTRAIQRRIEARPTGSAVYLLTDPAQRPLVGNLDRWPDSTPDEAGWIAFDLERGTDGDGPVHRARARVFTLRGGFHLLVGRDMRDLEATEQRIVVALLWGLAITLLLGIAGGAMLSRSVLRRIETINQTSREIVSGDLSRRIPERGTGDDFDQLAANLNGMLDRIEALMDDVRRVSDNIAHDLRTPLARLLNQLERLGRERPDPEARSEALERALAEAQRLLETFNALLRIARVESGERRAGFVDVDLAALAADVVEMYEPLAEERNQAIACEVAPSCRVRGDRDLLFQALANLLDNAVKYTPEGGAIALTAVAREDAVELCVGDDGPGVPADERERVLQRFYRLDHSRSTPGSGLGLSMVAAV